MAPGDSKILFKTIVGSHMWQMQRPDSDVDIFEGYIVPTSDILRGIQRKNSHQTQAENIDTASHEIGKIIDMLLKGNVNFVWGITSPNTRVVTPQLEELRALTKRQISKNIYHSIHGLAIHNCMRYIDNGKDLSFKMMATILRTLRFGRDLLNTGEFVYQPVVSDLVISPIIIQSAIGLLDDAYDNSELPEKPDAEPFREFLYRTRCEEWHDII